MGVGRDWSKLVDISLRVCIIIRASECSTRRYKLLYLTSAIWTVLISCFEVLIYCGVFFRIYLDSASFQSIIVELGSILGPTLAMIANLHVFVVIFFDVLHILVSCDQLAYFTFVHLCSLAVYSSTNTSILWTIYSLTESFLNFLFDVLSQTIGTKRMTTLTNLQDFTLPNDNISLQAYSTVIPLLSPWLTWSSFANSCIFLIQIGAQLNHFWLLSHSSICI